MNKLTLSHIKETFRKKGNNIRVIKFLLCLVLFYINTLVDYYIYIKIISFIVLFWIMLINITYLIIDYLDIKINHWKQMIYKHVCIIYKELLENRKDYNKKYIETVEFNNMFTMLIASNNKHDIIVACNFFKIYNRFSCKDKDNKFIISLFAYINGIERLDEKYLLMHRQNNN